MADRIHALATDRAMASDFIRALTGSADTVVTFQTFPDGGWDGSPRPPVYRHSTLSDAWEWICDAQEDGHGVFVMVNEGDGKGRSKANVVALRALFADDDHGTVTPAIRADLTPEIVVRSGNGMHFYWILRPREPLEAFTPAQKAIAARLGTDPAVCDLCRVMRLPGTFNLKDRSTPRLVEIEEVR